MLETFRKVISGCEGLSIRASLLSPHISCWQDAVAWARNTDWGYLTPKLVLSFPCDTSDPWGPTSVPPCSTPVRERIPSLLADVYLTRGG